MDSLIKEGDRLKITLTPQGIMAFDVADHPERSVTVSRVIPAEEGNPTITVFGDLDFPVNEIGFSLKGDENVQSVVVTHRKLGVEEEDLFRLQPGFRVKVFLGLDQRRIFGLEEHQAEQSFTVATVGAGCVRPGTRVTGILTDLGEEISFHYGDKELVEGILLPV